jgi:hypothetical protein
MNNQQLLLCCVSGLIVLVIFWGQALGLIPIPLSVFALIYLAVPFIRWIRFDVWR